MADRRHAGRGQVRLGVLERIRPQALSKSQVMTSTTTSPSTGTRTQRRPLPRSTPRPPRERAPAGSPLLAGVTAAGWALGAGLVALALPVLLVWATDSRSGSGAAAAARAAAQVWLVAHGTSLHVVGGTFGLTPLGLAALPLGLLWRAGRHAARTTGAADLRSAVRLTAGIAAPYAVGSAVVAALATTSAVRPAPVMALLCGLLVAVVGAGAGILRESVWAGEAAGRLHPRLRGLAVGTAAATSVLLLGGALLAGTSLALHASRAGVLARSTDPGIVGGLALLLLGALLVPNLVVWGVSWLSGPGFAVGVGTAVGPFATHLGPVPAVPLLAGLPAGPPAIWLGALALAVPVLAGAVAGGVVVRRLAVGWVRAAGEAALLGPCAGLAVALLAALSGGPVGGGRLIAVGPSPWQVGLAVTVEVAVGAGAAVALLVHRRDR